MPRSGWGARDLTAPAAPISPSRRQASGDTPSPQTLSRGKRASSSRRTSWPRWRSITAAAEPAGPPSTTITSRIAAPAIVLRRLPGDGQQPVREHAPDAHRDPRLGERGAQLRGRESPPDGERAVGDTHPRAQEERKGRAGEEVGHAGAADVVHDQRTPGEVVELAQHGGGARPVEVMEEM